MGKKRIKLTDENKSWGLTALIVICLSILFYLIMTRIPALKVGLGEIISVMLPFILGIVMAYLLLPIYNGINVRLRALLSKKMKEKTARRLASGISVIVSMLLLLTVVFGFVIIVVPQILKSVITISTMIPTKWDLLIEKVNALLKNNPQLMRYARQVLENAESMLNEVITDKLLPNFSNALTTVTTKIINAAGFLFDLIIGMIVCIYMLLGKERLSAQAKKIVYSRMSTKTANNLIADARRVHGIFAGYISGNLLDSLIVGLLCFIVLPFLNMPYVLLISVIVGVTNIIPFFGPFIGAIPSILLVLMDGSLKKAIILTVFIFILQQLDGNVIKPRALGNTTGLPSFWVLFSILVGGGLFGFAGLLFAVPVFATIYMFVSRNAERNLRKRRLPYETDDFIGVPALDPVTHQPVYDDSFMDDENTDSEEYQHEEDQSSDAVARSGSDRREMKSTDDCKDEAADASLGDTKSNDDKYNGSSSIRNKERNGENASHGDSRANASDGRIADAEEQSLNAKFKKYAALLGKAAYKKMKGVSSELKNRKSESHENKNGDAKHSKTENRGSENGDAKHSKTENRESEKGQAEHSKAENRGSEKGQAEHSKTENRGSENGDAKHSKAENRGSENGDAGHDKVENRESEKGQAEHSKAENRGSENGQAEHSKTENHEAGNGDAEHSKAENRGSEKGQAEHSKTENRESEKGQAEHSKTENREK